jgi:signal transduction histidine kinase/ActR/RegA family two-component response regulator
LGLFRTVQTERHPLLPFALLAAYVASATLAYTLTTGAGGLAVMWINNGLLAGALLLLPRIPAIQIAVLCTITDFLGAAISGTPPAQAMLIAGCDLLESVAAAILVRRVGGAALDITILYRFRRITLLAVLPATLGVATLGSTLSATLFGNDFLSVWLAWAAGDFLGMMLGLPGVLLLARFHRFNHSGSAGPWERYAWIAVAVACAASLFHFDHPALYYLFFPVGLLLVLRLSPPFSLLAILAFAMVAAGATVTGAGGFAFLSSDISGRILWLQLYLASLQFSALVLIGVLSQRIRAQAASRRALAAARETRKEAIEAAGAKGRFLAVMSHEMRTPLNGIAGYAQLLSARTDLTPDAQSQIRTISDSSEVLLGLISDVLDYSRNESGGLQLVETPFRAKDIVARSLEIVRPLLAGREIGLVMSSSIPDDLAHVGDERRLAQVLLNLLGNAVKFTERGRIAVSADCRPTRTGDADTLTITVDDTGIGIAPDKLDLVFTPFSQADASDQRSYAGAGLGLTISRSLIERMGGAIGVESQVGVGSRFWISLTLPRARLAPASVSGHPTVDMDGRQIQVLIVDDHPVNRQVATLMLEAAGMAVSSAEYGALAVEAVQSGAYDLVLMDLHMPVMDGLSACRAIRALGGPAAAVPVIAMTAAAMPEDIDRCMAAGMNAHIAKPIRQEELLQVALQQLVAQDSDDAD